VVLFHVAVEVGLPAAWHGKQDAGEVLPTAWKMPPDQDAKGAWALTAWQPAQSPWAEAAA